MAAQGNVTLNADGTARFDTTCILCDKPNSIDGLDPKAVAAWMAGEFAQRAFPELGDDEREILVSGSHPACFDAAYVPDEGDEEADWDDPGEFPEFPPGT
jgi:hypothetical protein